MGPNTIRTMYWRSVQNIVCSSNCTYFVLYFVFICYQYLLRMTVEDCQHASQTFTNCVAPFWLHSFHYRTTIHRNRSCGENSKYMGQSRKSYSPIMWIQESLVVMHLSNTNMNETCTVSKSNVSVEIQQFPPVVAFFCRLFVCNFFFNTFGNYNKWFWVRREIEQVKEKCKE